MPNAAHSRSNARRLAIFNHKGGVGKTTLTMNVGAALAGLGRRVLLVDSDPQCNLTSYLVAEEVVDDLLDNSDTAGGRTLWSAVKPLSEALGGIRTVRPIEPGIEGAFLVPGDIRLSEFEVDLNGFWAECLQRKARGFRGMTAISHLVDELCVELSIDYVLYDSGPNIGPLNRAILLDCDYFIVPVACDLFSLRALKTLGRTLVDWVSSWKTIADLAPSDMTLLPGRPSFLGYIPEGFKVYAGAVTRQQSSYLTRIDREIHDQVIAILRELDPDLVSSQGRSFRLGEVKDFGALVSASQRDGTPLYQANGGSSQQRESARTAFATIAQAVDARAVPKAN
jgi:cellulose biosynthesis protein BcsQ